MDVIVFYYIDTIIITTGLQPTILLAKAYHLAPVIGIKLVRPKGAEVLLVARLCNLLHLFGGELEGRHLGEISLQPLLVGAGSNGYDALVNGPAQADLGLGDAVLFRQPAPERRDGPILEARDGNQGPVCSDCDLVLVVEVEQVAVLQVRVELDLVDGRRDLGSPQDDLEMLLEEVGNADGLGFAGLLDGLHVGPFLLQDLIGAAVERDVDEVEVDVVQTQFLQGGIKVLLGDLGIASGKLGGDKETLPGHARRLDAGPQLLLVVVHCKRLVSLPGTI